MRADTKKVWRRLSRGHSLEGLGLPTKEGRLDLSEFSAPQPRTEWYSDSRFSFGLLRGMLDLRRITWRNLDFRGADLRHLRFDRCLVDDCIFDECDCRDWRLWGSRISRCSFRGADLRESALGNTTRGWNTWEDVDFSGADLRDTTYRAGEFVRCRFGDAKLAKVDFGGMSFRDCVFEGLLDEVTFDAEPFPPGPFPRNEMQGVDMRCATLKLVDFRRLDLETVRLPEDDEHILIDDYRPTLERALGVIQGRQDLLSREFAAILEHSLKWAGPHQQRGIISKAELREMGEPGDDPIGYLKELLRIARSPR